MKVKAQRHGKWSDITLEELELNDKILSYDP